VFNIKIKHFVLQKGLEIYFIFARVDFISKNFHYSLQVQIEI